MLKWHRIAAAAGTGALVLSGMATLALGSGVVGASTLRTTPAMCGTAATPPIYKHIVIVMEENYSYDSIYKSSQAPYINSVISACGLATDYHNITHYSLPNYVGITDGMSVTQLHPYLNDCSPSPTCEVKATQSSIFQELVGHGGWKSYEESMPKNCDRSDSGNYAAKHNPAVYYLGLKDCSTQDVPLGTTSGSALLKDFSSETTAPALAFVTPNLIDDMHNSSVKAGDDWLKVWLPLITSTKVYMDRDTAIFIVWDEGEPSVAGANCVDSTAQSCHVAMIVVAPSVKPGLKVAISYSHYSWLKTAEDLLGVAELGQAKSATSMAKGFNL